MYPISVISPPQIVKTTELRTE